MNTYALIGKYRGAYAVYIRELRNGQLEPTVRITDELTSGVARKVAHDKGFVTVKSWKDAEHLAELEVEAAEMQPDEPLVWKNYVDGGHRAKTEDGVYSIDRYHVTENGSLEPGRAGGRKAKHRWVMTFTDDDQIMTHVPWLNEDERQTLDNAKAACQAHANLRLLSTSA